VADQSTIEVEARVRDILDAHEDRQRVELDTIRNKLDALSSTVSSLSSLTVHLDNLRTAITQLTSQVNAQSLMVQTMQIELTKRQSSERTLLWLFATIAGVLTVCASVAQIYAVLFPGGTIGQIGH